VSDCVAQGDVPLAVEIGGARVAKLAKLSGKGIRFKLDVVWMLAMVSSEGGPKDRQLHACFQSPEAYDGLLHRRCGPA
jgi:hypothetical protein